jgi:hypothetical protein
MKSENKILLISILSFFLGSYVQLFSQRIYQEYDVKPNDSLRIGNIETVFLKYIEKGYTLALPEIEKSILGILIFLEDSGFDSKNNSAKQIYAQANTNGFAVLSVSTEIPLDFFFAKKSILYVNGIIKKVIKKYNLPNKNIFFLGVGLSGHRILKYIEFSKKNISDFDLNITGIILCDAVLDWVRQWYEAKKVIQNNFEEGAVWEANLGSYLLETNLQGTPKNNIEKYLDFSTYSFFDEKNRHIKYYKDYSFRVYTEPATKYWIKTKRKATFETNFPDMVGIITELKLYGNEKSELIIINPKDTNSERKNPNHTWSAVDKDELLEWIINEKE